MKNTDRRLDPGSTVSRRAILSGMAGAAAALAWPGVGRVTAAERTGRIKQSVCLWCYGEFLRQHKMSLDQFAAACRKMGLRSIELTTPDQWPTLKKHELICAMTPSHGIDPGLNRVEHHEKCLAKIRKAIDDTAAAGFPNVICCSGNRKGMDDAEGLKNCVTALRQIAPCAEKKQVTVCLELLNSADDHPDYMADSTRWCVELVQRVGSPRVKVLYDIYHAAMMKEDVLADIKNHADCWGHFHTGGVPGRHEIDGTQKLDYRRIMGAILATGYQGYVGQEFVPRDPKGDALGSLEQAVRICDQMG
jgi:hydroxypyruvate isomerase